jgi:hypothetical protein
VLGANDELNQALERAGRVADFFELGELMCIDALVRRESCGGHFRVESQTPDGEALRVDEEFAYVSAWEFGGDNGRPILHKEAAGLRVRRDEAAELQVKVTLRVWRQANSQAKGKMAVYTVNDISEDMSFLEMLDVFERAADAAGRRSDRFRQRLP